MMGLIEITNGEITGWIFGSNTHDLRRQLDYPHPCAEKLYRWEFPEPGKHEVAREWDAAVGAEKVYHLLVS